MRAVLDVNVLISALISPRGVPSRLIQAWVLGAFELVVSPRLLEELDRVLGRPRIQSLIASEDARGLVELIAVLGSLAEDPQPGPRRSRDAKDDYLVELARSMRAVLVTGDRDLLDLEDQLPVHTPTDFLRLLEE